MADVVEFSDVKYCYGLCVAVCREWEVFLSVFAIFTVEYLRGLSNCSWLDSSPLSNLTNCCSGTRFYLDECVAELYFGFLGGELAMVAESVSRVLV